jgi:alpha-N-arabinofuranosidase
MKRLLVSLLLAICVSSRAAENNPLPATVTIRADRVTGPISSLLYGQFIEFMFEGIKGGLHAELIRDRSFEGLPNSIGLPRYWERYPDDRNDDYGIAFLWDDREAYPPTGSTPSTTNHSLCVTLREGVIPRHGVFQSGIPLRAGIEYTGYVWLKGSNFTGRVRVALEQDMTGGEIYAETDVGSVTDVWKQCSFTLKPVKADPLARLAILLEGYGFVWVDQASLMPGDAVDGVRRDVFDKVRALRPAFIRWPGGNVAQDYHWKHGTGPRDRRITWPNLSWKNEPEPSDFGTDEFIQFCRRLGAEPSITVNVEGLGATAEEAAAWVKYCNTSGPERRVRLWEVGNEIWGDWVRGHTDAKTYAHNLNRYATAMRGVDPAIQLIAVGDNDTNWNATVLRLAGTNVDYLAIHHYYMESEIAGDPMNLMARPLYYERFYSETRRMLRESVPHTPIKLAINEWGLGVPVQRQYSIEAALYAARLMNVFERNSDVIAMTAVSDLVNGWPGGIIQASRHGLFVSPIYIVNQLYREYQGSNNLSVTVSGPAFDTSRESNNIPYLDVVASSDVAGSHIFVKAVNVHPTKTLDVAVRVNGSQVSNRGEMFLISTDSPQSYNSFQTPDAVKMRNSKIDTGPEFRVSLPKQTIAVLRLNRSNAVD